MTAAAKVWIVPTDAAVDVPSMEELEQLSDQLGSALLQVEDVTTKLRNVRSSGGKLTLEQIGAIAVFTERVAEDARELNEEVAALRILIRQLAPEEAQPR
jgi:hypothetical protein